MRRIWPAILVAADFALGAQLSAVSDPAQAQYLLGLARGDPFALGTQLGATTDGPSSIGNFAGLGTVPGMRACSAGQFASFNNTTAGYEDNVVSWPSVEPADDYTAAALFAFALGESGLG
jgi:hypothetical protein